MADKNKSNKKTVQVTARVEPRIKDLAEELFSSLGLNMSTAIDIFLRQSIRDGKIPFEITSHLSNPRLETKEERGHDFISDYLSKIGKQQTNCQE